MKAAFKMIRVLVFPFLGVVFLCAIADKTLSAPRLQLSAVQGFGGATIRIPLSLRYATNDVRNVVGLQADLLFNPTLATGSGPARGQVLTDHLIDSNTFNGGWQRVLIYSEAYRPITNGELATFSLSVGVGVLQNVRLILSNVFLTTAVGEVVPATVTSGGIVINVVFLQPDGKADGYLTVNTNDPTEQCYVVQATEDFRRWVNVDTNTATGSFLLFADRDAGLYAHRFYRAVLCEAATGARIGDISRLLDGRVEFNFNGFVGLNYLIQASTNLHHWDDLMVMPGISGTMTFVDPGSTNFPQRFYRVRFQ